MSKTVLITGFPDEMLNFVGSTEVALQIWAALGPKYYCLRFSKLGTLNQKNVMELDDTDVERLQELHVRLGLRVSCVASPIGKVPLARREDEFARVERAIQLCEAFGCREVRIFSLETTDDDPTPHLSVAAKWVAQVCDMLERKGLYAVLEVERGLVGRNGELQAQIAKQANRQNLSLLHDGGNLTWQRYSKGEVLHHFGSSALFVGEIHVKDGQGSRERVHQGEVTFVTPGSGDSAYAETFEQLACLLSLSGTTANTYAMRDLPGFPLGLEPHTDGGGKFGGQTLPRNMGRCVRALCRMLQKAGLEYQEAFND